MVSALPVFTKTRAALPPGASILGSMLTEVQVWPPSVLSTKTFISCPHIKR